MRVGRCHAASYDRYLAGMWPGERTQREHSLFPQRIHQGC